PATPPLYTLSLHDALPISFEFSVQKYIHQLQRCTGTNHPGAQAESVGVVVQTSVFRTEIVGTTGRPNPPNLIGRHGDSYTGAAADRKSTRLNSSHVSISYA